MESMVRRFTAVGISRCSRFLAFAMLASTVAFELLSIRSQLGIEGLYRLSISASTIPYLAFIIGIDGNALLSVNSDTRSHTVCCQHVLLTSCDEDSFVSVFTCKIIVNTTATAQKHVPEHFATPHQSLLSSVGLERLTVIVRLSSEGPLFDSERGDFFLP
jgi:hypothetical protein